jgi:hypothetical protein
MDAVDQAQGQTDLDLELALKNRKVVSLPDTGLCHYCSDPIEKGHFCDSFCRDDYEQINRNK